jgi:hypothetical protein
VIRTQDLIDPERQEWKMNFVDGYDLALMRSFRRLIVCRLFSSGIGCVATR